MKKEEYETIIEIIDADIARQDLDDLKKLKNYIELKIKSTEEQYIDTENCYDILTMKLKDFLYKNITSRGFKKVNFLMVMKEITQIDSYDRIYVFDTIGINRKTLLKKRNGAGIGEHSLALFEDALRCHGIERGMKMQIEEKEALNSFREGGCFKRKIK